MLRLAGAALAALILSCAAAVAGGPLTLRACPALHGQCGRLMRPLDPTGRVPGSIGIAFLWLPHLHPDQPAAGTIVATEGGPGYPTIASRDAYLRLFAPLRGDHDMLLMDNRGTGLSQAIDCRALQDMPVPTIAAYGACGASLGRAADLYGTGLAADDLAALLDALHIDRIDLYGDSYGTFFGQTFAARHPDRLRSVVLDGAYPVIGEDPFYAAAGAAVRRDFDLVCERAVTCRDLPGRLLDRIGRLLDALRAKPVRGSAYDANGQKLAVTADPAAIGNILYDGTSGPVNYRELDPAARAYLDQHDAAPLLRLIAENIRTEGTGLPAGPAHSESRGLFGAVSCMDYPQIYDMTAPAALRRAQSAERIAARQASDPGTYAPLTIAEWLTVPLDISVLNLCLDWPMPAPPYPPGQPVPEGATFTAAPTLVISGELDALTTPAEAAQVTALFPHARHLIVANSFHVDAVDDVDDCASRIVQHFVATLDIGDTGCAERINEVRMPPAFVRRAADTPAATAAAGNAAPPPALALAAAAVQTAGDVLARAWESTGGPGVGLRGGTYDTTKAGAVIGDRLHGVRWAADMAVSGQIAWDQSNGAIHGALSFAGPGAAGGRLDVRWNDRDPHALAQVAGVVDGHRLVAEMPAP